MDSIIERIVEKFIEKLVGLVRDNWALHIDLDIGYVDDQLVITARMKK